MLLIRRQGRFTAKWLPLPHPMVIDSGAAVTVMPKTWCMEHETKQSAASKAGDFYTTADGGIVENEGEKVLTLATQDGGMRHMVFQVVAVNKSLGSVSQIVANGNRVVFDTGGSYIQNVSNGEKLWLREANGVYVLDVLVAPPESQPDGRGQAAGFTRPGQF